MSQKRSYGQLDPLKDTSIKGMELKKTKIQSSARKSNAKLMNEDKETFFERFLLEHSSYD